MEENLRSIDSMVKVGMGDLKVSKQPYFITTLGLGSCVGITLYDRTNKIGGLLHAMLPDSTRVLNSTNKAKFVDTGLLELLHELEKIGANISRLEAKLAGGAQMFASSNTQVVDYLQIGNNNIKAAKAWLQKLAIRIVAEETGENFGRTITLNTVNGELEIKTVGQELRVI